MPFTIKHADHGYLTRWTGRAAHWRRTDDEAIRFDSRTLADAVAVGVLHLKPDTYVVELGAPSDAPAALTIDNFADYVKRFPLADPRD